MLDPALPAQLIGLPYPAERVTGLSSRSPLRRDPFRSAPRPHETRRTTIKVSTMNSATSTTSVEASRQFMKKVIGSSTTTAT